LLLPRRNTAFLVGVNASSRYSKWPVFSCPLMAGLHVHRGRLEAFYARAGFYECPVDPMMMMITLAEVEKNLSPPSAS
jgi:hypothetical protein